MTHENDPEDPPLTPPEDLHEEVPPAEPPADPPPPEEDDEKKPGWVDALGDRIIDAINDLKETSPVTPPEEHVLDETPLKRPWTHRGFGSRK